jgi:tRNA modification GTPase
MNRSSRLLIGGGDTIVALATPPGRSATGMVRMSGARAFEIAQTVTGSELPVVRVAVLRTIHGEASLSSPRPIIDRCVVTTFAAPASYTGEDTVEFSVHGGWMVPALVLETLIRAGARQALPGEFTRRAMLNGRMDLLQAEGVADLIDSRSRGAAAAALSQLDGGLTRRITELRSAVLEVEALIAYDIDFPEEDDGPIERVRITRACDELLAQLSALLATADAGEILREGALVVIAGVPNAGKSSLFNALLGRRRALVTDVPGTTRDALEAVIDADAWTLRLVDTAGLRSAADIVERLGIEVAEEYLSRARIVLVCGQDLASLDVAVSRTRALTVVPIIAVLTKADVQAEGEQLTSHSIMKHYESLGTAVDGVFAVSALTGAGLAQLLAGIGAVLERTTGVLDAETPLLLRARHHQCVSAAEDELRQFRAAFVDGAIPMPVAATHLRAAADALESLIGTVGVEDVLARVFSSFCVGK